MMEVNNINNSFSLSRFWNLCKWEFVANRRMIFIRFLAVAVTLLVVFLIGRLFIKSYTGDWEADSIFIAIFSSVTFCVMGALYASSIAENLRTKGARIPYLMLPATAFEKFLARFLYVTVGFLVLFFASFFLADVVSAFLSWLTGRTADFALFFSMLGDKYEMLSGLWNQSFVSELQPLAWEEVSFSLFWFSSIVSLLVAHAVFMLGGVIFNSNHAFIKTLLAIVVFRIAMTIIFSILIIAFGSYLSTLPQEDFLYNIKGLVEQIHNGVWVWNSVCLLGVFAVWYVAYHRIKTVQVVKGGRK